MPDTTTDPRPAPPAPPVAAPPDAPQAATPSPAEPAPRITFFGPGMEAPVEEGGLQRLARGSRRGRHGRGRLEEMLQRLAHAEVHQADAHAGGEQHGGPGDEAELGLSIIGTQADITETAGRDEDQKDQEQRDRD